MLNTRLVWMNLLGGRSAVDTDRRTLIAGGAHILSNSQANAPLPDLLIGLKFLSPIP